jgi:hypothetical protein
MYLELTIDSSTISEQKKCSISLFLPRASLFDVVTCLKMYVKAINAVAATHLNEHEPQTKMCLKLTVDTMRTKVHPSSLLLSVASLFNVVTCSRHR